MWTLHRSADDFDFPLAASEGALLEWITVGIAILALIGVIGLCVCPYFATPGGEAARKAPRNAHYGSYAFLADLQFGTIVPRQADAGSLRVVGTQPWAIRSGGVKAPENDISGRPRLLAVAAARQP